MQNRKGFTLIELLIVVVIIGILAAIAIPKFANTKEKAVLASMKSDLRNLVTAQEAFFSDNQLYATDIDPLAQTATKVQFKESSGNVLKVGVSTPSGWNATILNPAVKGTIKFCGIYVGDAATPNGAVKNEGAPACY